MAGPSSGSLTKQKGILVYGATGHTGKLIAAKLKERGITATLAGRNEEKLKYIMEHGNLLRINAND